MASSTRSAGRLLRGVAALARGAATPAAPAIGSRAMPTIARGASVGFFAPGRRHHQRRTMSSEPRVSPSNEPRAREGEEGARNPNVPLLLLLSLGALAYNAYYYGARWRAKDAPASIERGSETRERASSAATTPGDRAAAATKKTPPPVVIIKDAPKEELEEEVTEEDKEVFREAAEMLLAAKRSAETKKREEASSASSASSAKKQSPTPRRKDASVAAAGAATAARNRALAKHPNVAPALQSDDDDDAADGAASLTPAALVSRAFDGAVEVRRSSPSVVPFPFPFPSARSGLNTQLPWESPCHGGPFTQPTRIVLGVARCSI